MVALEPGVIVAYERNTDTNTALRNAGHQGHHDRRLRARPRARRRPLHDVSRSSAIPRSEPGWSQYVVQPPQPELPQGDRLRAAGAALPAAAVRGAEDRQVRRAPRSSGSTGKEIALDLREDVDRTRSAFEVAAFDQGAHVTYLDPVGLAARAQGVGGGHRAGARAACTTPSSSAATRRPTSRSSAEFAGVPVYNGLTDEWHPTQMLADFLTMHEASGKPYDELAYAFVGDCRFNMGRSLLVMGALMGADVRLAGPPSSSAGRRRRDRATRSPDGRARRSRSPTTSAQAVLGRRLRAHRRVGVDGRVEGRVGRAGRAPAPYQVNATLLDATGNRKAKFMHCLPAFHDPNTVVGRRSWSTPA